MANQDYLLDENGDLLIKDGDFVIGFSDNQHIQDIIECFPGEWKQFPLVGCGIMTELNSQRPQEAINKVSEQLKRGGYQVDLLDIKIINSALKIGFPNGIKYNV